MMMAQKRLKLIFLSVLILNIAVYFLKDIIMPPKTVFKMNGIGETRTVTKRSRIFTTLSANRMQTRPPVVRKSTTFNNFQERVDYFTTYWILQHTMRTNYRKIIAPCENNMDWWPFYPDYTPDRITSANKSLITVDIQAAGQYSRLLIESYSRLNTEKVEGGDSWRVHIVGTTSIPVTVLDNQDGSYEASFLIVEPGIYFAEIFLDYTLCDGYKDPPPDWFVQGLPWTFQSPFVPWVNFLFFPFC